MNEKSINASLLEAVVTAKAIELFTDLGKMIVDRVFSEAVRQELPMLGRLRQIWKLGPQAAIEASSRSGSSSLSN